ncbi:MAG: ABC transporter ATP-binding protein [Desulfobacca sp.]|nr:ABC transporter ATP-binding protein [Desulfobacca sp.]
MKMQDLGVGYDHQAVVRHISQEIRQGQFVSLLGPNGAGKTTILRTLARLLAPQQGTIFLDGKNLQDYRQADLARTLAVVLTERNFFGMFTGFDFVALGRYPHTGFLGRLQPKDILKTQKALHLVNAADLAERYFNELSDGERQKLLLARALAQEPKIIILDEPTIHLDLKHRLEVMTILRRFCRDQGISVIASLHDVDIASKVSDIVALVRDGRIIGWGPPEDLLNEATVTHLYELNAAAYNRWLGAIEMKGDGTAGKVFVVAGGGTGTTMYRLLAKQGFAVTTGVIHENDIDCYVAKALGATLIMEKPLEFISEESMGRAQGHLNGNTLVIDTGFPVTGINQSNLELLKLCLAEGKRIFTLREKAAARKLLGADYQKLVFCQDEIGILRALTSHH